ncbi:MAG: phenylalanine--tRNA ligase subunit beta [Sedimentisphaerales bacterium]|nr:phenylalanine--tRNA ligase subunit beta [Sedimentisphaerales bacterium]
MKISLKWLKDYVEIAEPAEALAQMLSDVGFPTESIETFGDDTIIDVEVTSNRGDCLSHIGIAREIAAATGRQLKLPEIKYEPAKKDINSLVSVEIAEPELCGRYTARIIEGVKVGPSPAWMVERLEAVGLRSVNNVVDATNYAMMETGQPPHAFDYEKIKDKKIIVRKAKKGEKLVSIDSTQCNLEEDMLIIADAKGPVAIAGVMGGLETEVSDSTRSILLEDASFDPVSVRTTSRKLSLPSESSFRFGRIIDIEKVDWASQRTAQLIVEVAGGQVVEGLVDAYPARWQQKTVEMRFSRLNKLLGIEVPADRVMEIFKGLCFEPQADGDKVTCTIPSWRSDISREADLIEEAARVYGYDKVGLQERISIEVAGVDRRQHISCVAGGFLNSCGFYEAITTSFCDAKSAKLISGKDAQNCLAVQDETRKSENLLRNSLTGSLLNVVRHNYNSGNKNVRLYEIASVFRQGKDNSCDEHTSLTLICDSDFRVLKGALCGVINTISPNAEVVLKPCELQWAKAGAGVLVDGKMIGSAGVLKDEVVSGFDIKSAQICCGDLNFDALLELEPGQIKARPIPKFPAIVRDLSLIVDEQIPWAQLEEVVRSKAPKELENIKFEGIYRGKPIAANKKSVTVSMCFRDEDGTLQHEVVDGWQEKIVSALTSKIKAQIRQV